MHINDRKEIPISEGLWAKQLPTKGEPRLIGSRCPSCGEFFFPRKPRGICVHCQHQGLEEVELSQRGKIASFTVAMQPPGGGFYKGSVPYAYGCVDLPEGVRVETLFTGCDFGDLKVGAEVQLVIERLYTDDEGNEITTYKFKPIL